MLFIRTTHLQIKTYYENGSEQMHQVYNYDSEQRLISINAGTPRCNISYGYNAAQQIAGMNEIIAGTERRFSYDYDQRDQLTEETEWDYIDDPDAGGWFEGPPNVYSYDHAQNRVAQQNYGRGGNETYGYALANRMTNIWRGSPAASSRYWYDLAGNLSTSIVGYATNCYHYNVQNRLVKIVGTNFVHEFKYNSRSERIAVGTSLNGATMTWRYDACQGPVTLAEFDASAAMTRWYVRGLGVAQGIGDVVAEVDVTASPKAHYYLCNHRGDTLVVLNSSGTVTARMRYDAFGNMYDVSTNSVYFPRYTFSTKEYLSQPKLYLYAYRVYDPAAGRWTQRDPIDYQDSLNLYQFCGNNGMNSFDTMGLWGAKTHRMLTSAVLGQIGCDDKQIATACQANTKVDSIWNQGNDAAHYMPGHETDAQILIDTCMEKAISYALGGDIDNAMKALGQGLHTLQDKSAHSDQGAGWKSHMDGSTPDNPLRHMEQFRDAYRASMKYVRTFEDRCRQEEESRYCGSSL